MESAIALEEFQKIVQQHPKNADFCERELNWIKNRSLDWHSDRIRVGVIGVTSSGKSTLINAILGTDILSSAVAPSSGQLVCCSYGEKPEIIIHFENGTEKKLSGKDFSRDMLERYSDERFNTKNKEQVLSIELTSPQFDLGEDVLLVDSPGLDAFGLEAHERLTLESLVPTIDACIYVTTMKTNSDQKTQEILNAVAKYNCPIIIVQNMLDAVRPSPSGDQTCEQVAADHKKRVQEIVDKSNITDKDSVQIIQTSAEIAKRWRSAQTSGDEPAVSEEAYRKSNYQAFVESVIGILDVQRPRIERQRLISISSCATALKDSIHDKITKPAVDVEEDFPLQALKNRTIERRSAVQKEYSRILDEYQTRAKAILVAIGAAVEEETIPKQSKTGQSSATIAQSLQNFTKRIREGVEKLGKTVSGHDAKALEESLKDTNDAVKAFETALADLVSKHNAFVISAAQGINVPSRDLLCSSALHSFRAVSVKKKTETITCKVKKDTLGGRLSRGFGWLFRQSDWGYEYKSREEVVIDYEETKKEICARLADAYERYTNSMEDWKSKHFNHSMDIIEAEIQSAEESYLKKKAAAVERESLAELDKGLSKFIEQVNNGLPIAECAKYEETQGTVFTSKEMEVSDYVEAVLRLSRSALQQQHRAIARAFVTKIGCESSTPIVISWDDRSTDEFLWQTGLTDANILQSPVSNAGIPRKKERCLFVLVNAIQYGAARKQIDALKIHETLTKRDHVVWVVQDFQELLTGDRAVEGLSNMAELSSKSKFAIPCESSIYIVHENPIYNLTFFEHQFDRRHQQVPSELIDRLQGDFGVYLSPGIKNTLGEILLKVHLDR